MIGENGVPETPDWAGESRRCPFADKDCDICADTLDHLPAEQRAAVMAALADQEPDGLGDN